MSDTVHVDMLQAARLLAASSDPDIVIIRMTTQEGNDFNFGVPFAYMPVLIKQWEFDMQSLQAAKESGSPMPGKPLGQPDKKPS